MEAIGSREFDPYELEIDPVNERVSNVGFHTEKDDALIKSIEQMGVTSPIVVRKKEGDFYVVAGQRRTLAAREADVESIPARIYEMDDQDAKLVSITENADQYDKDVPPADRAKSIDSLLNDGLEIDEIADAMGVSKPTVERWWEPARDYWEDTEFEADTENDDSPLDNLSLTAMSIIRENTSSPEQSERIANKVIKNNVQVKFVEEAEKVAENPEEFENKIDNIIAALEEGIQQISEKVRFTEEEAEKLESIMRNRGVNEKQAIEMLVEERLEQMRNVDDGELLLLYLPGEIVTAVEDVISGTKANKEAFCRQVVKKKLEETGYM